MVFTSTVSPLLKIGLRIIGAWPDVPYTVFIRLLFVSSFLVVQYFQYLYVFAHFKLDELSNLVDCVPVTLDFSSNFIKAMILWKYQRVVRDILTSMDTDWRECVNVDQHLHLMKRKASITHFYSNVLFSFYTFAGTVFYIGSNAFAIVHHQTADDNDTSPRPFPIKIPTKMLPFEAEQSPVYETLVIALFLHAMLNVCSLTTLNALILTLVYHVGGQIDIIYEELETISEKISDFQSSKYTLKILVEKHIKVITFSENLDKLFSFMALMQIFINTLVICGLELIIITSIGNEFGVDLVKAVFAYVAIVIEIFILCFAGEYLSLKSKSLANAAYNTLWYNMSTSQSKSMLFVIMRCQKQLTITAGGMTNLSFEAFTSIMKASASYMSVLYAMY